MNKLLFITNLANKIGNFSIPCIDAAHHIDSKFYMAANWGDENGAIRQYENTYGIKIFNLPITRNPFSKSNLTAYKELVEFIKQEKIDYIHCNTPTGGVLGRLAGKKCNVKKVIYQAHGFHFYRGAPKKNRLMYYSVEKWLAHYTDAIITINAEDFEAAKKFRLRNNGKVYYVPGVGIDTEMYRNIKVDRAALRSSFGIKETDTVCISMGDLVPRKNYAVAIDAISKCTDKSIHYLLAGVGPELENLKKLAKEKGVSERIHFLGFRPDIKELLQISDIFLFTTLQEGLPRSMMEAMASGLPCVVSKIRGNVDLIKDGEGGYLVPANDADAFAGKLDELSENRALCESMSKKNLERIKDFDIEKVREKMREIYNEVLK